MSCLERARTNFWYRKCTTKNNSNPSLITDSPTLAMFELDAQLNNPPLPTFWCLHELNVFARKNSRNMQEWIPSTNMSHKPLFGSASHLANMGSWKAGSPASNPQILKVAKSWISTSLHCLAAVTSVRQPRSKTRSRSPHLGYHNSIFCKHDAMSWWSVLPLSGTSSFWKGVEA